MEPARMTPLLNVLDIEASVSFYGALGFVVRERWDGRGGRAWRLLTCGELRLMLNQTARAASEHRRARPDYSDLVLYLYVDDAPACWRELQAAGIRPGPRFGELLSTAETLQLDRALPDRDAALRWLSSAGTSDRARD